VRASSADAASTKAASTKASSVKVASKNAAIPATAATASVVREFITAASSPPELEQVTSRDVREACIAARTQRAYAGSLRTLSRWIVDTKKQDSHLYFDKSGQINLRRFTSADFEAFLLEKRKTVGVSSLNGYRSAIKDLYRRNELPLPSVYEKSMSTFFSGLKRLQASKLQGGAPTVSGKDPLPYSLYHKLCEATLFRQDAGFTHFFLTTQWNLMCRSDSVQSLCTEHLSAHDDSVGCIMHKSKTNQEGNGPKDPRHIYANPMNPATCWITALGIYLACRPTQPAGPLFSGAQQKARFGTALRQLVNEKTGLNHYGTHSIRKGVATFACSGTTGGPSIASVCLRVGWSLGGVQDRYIRYESAGDQYLGRVVAGLPLNSADFAVLPPHFDNNQDPAIRECLSETFPLLHETSTLQDILKLCLASLVCHADYLRERMPSTHTLLSTYLFRHSDVLDQLRCHLVLGSSSWMKPTGIPPHVELYKQLQVMQRSIDDLAPVLLEGISTMIEEKGVAAGNITKELLEATIEKLLGRAVVADAQPSEPQASRESEQTSRVHFYNGKFHLLPQTFEFPRTGPFGAWMLWWFGDKHRGYPPLKKVRSHDLPNHTMHKIYSDWSVVIRHISSAIELAGLAIPANMTEQQARNMFQIGMEGLTLSPSTRKRRLAELSISTVLRLIREAQQKKSSPISNSEQSKRRRIA